jgi:peptide/nickel transport system substrate-binding protein
MVRFTRTGATFAALALAGALALAACGKSTSSTANAAAKGYAGIPAPAAHKVKGGTVTYGMSAGDTPTYIFPIVPSADSSVYAIDFFQDLMWRPMWWTPTGHELNVNYADSLAGKPVFSNGNKTVTITMKSGYKWSNGAPVDASDALFYIDLLTAAVKLSPANSGNFSPGFFPQNIASAKATGKYTLQITFTKAYNPSFTYYTQLDLITPLPSTSWDIDKVGGKPLNWTVPANAAKIYTFLNAQSGKLSTYATNPLWQDVDGPFHLTAFNASTDANTLVPNTHYTGPNKPVISKFQEVAYTSDTAEFNALRSGALDVGLVPANDYPQVPTLKKNGYNVFGYPDFGWDYMYFNFANKTDNWDKIIGQLYVRQALAHLVDDSGIIKSVDHGYAVPANGPVPSLPSSPFTPSNAATPVYSFSTSAAKSLLTAHGWKDVGGVQTCESPGSGSSDCGAGIPKGATLAFTLSYNNQSPGIISEDTSFASEAKSIGIKVTLSGKTFNELLTDDDNVGAPSNVPKWQVSDFGGFTESYYPTTNTIFNSTGSYNFGSYDSAEANALITKSVYSSNPSAVKNEATYLSKDLPALFQPEADHVYAWTDKLSGPQASFWELPQFAMNPEEWYFTK